MSIRILVGDCRQMLRTLPDASVHCAVTSPPYFGLRDYQVEGQIGREQTPDGFVAEMVTVFSEVRRILRNDGTLFLNLGDSYANDGKWGGHTGGKHVKALHVSPIGRNKRYTGMKPKDLIGIPWRVAFALQADGWYLRQWMPWVKRNPMPESTQDRPTSACETIFMLTKSQHYFFDYEGVKRRMAPASFPRLEQDTAAQRGSERANGGTKTNGTMKAVGKIDKQSGHSRRHAGFNDRWDKMEVEEPRGDRAFRNSDLFFDSIDPSHGAIFNGEDFIAMDVATQPFRGAHFAVFPPRLVEPLIKASSPEGGAVLDPFFGAGTTGLVSDRLGRDCIGIELNPVYAKIAADRIRADAQMFSNIVVEAA